MQGNTRNPNPINNKSDEKPLGLRIRESIGMIFRRKRILQLKHMIDRVYSESGCVNIIDLGGTEQYWRLLPEEYLKSHMVVITIVNLPGFISLEDHGNFKFIEGDACCLSEIEDNSFHISHSNSVIEHVGSWSRIVEFVDEVRRIADRYYVQTPNYWFPIDPHSMFPFFHWLPKPWRVWLLRHFQLGWLDKAASLDEAVRMDESINMLDRKMFQALFKDAAIITERILGFPKSFIAIRNG